MRTLELRRKFLSFQMARFGKNHKGGRPKGSKSAATLEKEAVLKAFRERVMKNAEILLDSQMTLARGQTFLYKIEKELTIGPKGGKSYRAKKPELVISQWEIEMFLDGEVRSEPLDSGPGATYYYLTTKEPNNMAVDSLLDRTFGKAVQAIELGGPNGKSLFTDEHKTKADKAIGAIIDVRDLA